MSVGIRIEVQSQEVEARLRRLMAGLTSRTPMNTMIGEHAAELTRNHLVAIAQTRHDTAERLGAAPTGH